MKDFFNKLGIFLIYIFIIFLLYILYILVSSGYNININNNGVSILTGTTSTGGNILSGVQINLPIDDDYSNYSSYYKSGNYRSFFPPNQLGTTQEMLKYVSSNTFQFSIPKKIEDGYLYIRIKKPTDNDIFLYWFNSKQGDSDYVVSGYADKDKSLIKTSDTEFLYKLKDVRIKPYYKGSNPYYNRASQMKIGDQNFIAGYVKDFGTNNKIEEITIARE